MLTLNTSIIACVTAAAVAVIPTVYSQNILFVGTCTNILSLFPKSVTKVSSFESILMISSTLFLISGAFPTISSFISLPIIIWPFPPNAPVASADWVPLRSTATVLTILDTMLCIASFFRGLRASNGTPLSTSLPLSEYKSILSLYFGI
ncbi:MAG: hypothetical protein AMQ74_00912 [Candidatus Methanofastidiosum methylothiophilum]|uniref:Uncharacterized protein n=1 Tax=Candidatus Methanofastidiosum methylothiophilum TaxID=1705564 RepID=A0A150J454_9EURY|nr:MAG: hypothetical protein AMQ74_00912 [Candidatus Methanofastidiosum methylthiophilus]